MIDYEANAHRMINAQDRRKLAAVASATIVGTFVAAAYLRGSFLLGVFTGAIYAAVALAISVLVIRAISNLPASKYHLVLVLLFAIPVSMAFAFPHVINPELQGFVHDHAVERLASTELDDLSRSDLFRNVDYNVFRSKVVVVSIKGEVASQQDLDLLRKQVLDDCSFSNDSWIRWEVFVIENATLYTGSNDDELDAEQR